MSQPTPQIAHNIVVFSVSSLACQAGLSVSSASCIQHLNPDNNTVADFMISASSPSGILTIVDVQIRNTRGSSSFDNNHYPIPVLEYAERAQKSETHRCSSFDPL